MRIAAVSVMLAAACFAQQNAMHIRAAMSAYQAGRKAITANAPEQAAQLFQKAIEIEPTFPEAYQGLIEAELRAEHRLKAGAALTRLLQIEPDSIPHRLLLAKILCEQKQMERALAQYALVLKRAPSNADALAGFAETAKQLGMNERAAEAAEQGRKLYPADKRFRSDLPAKSSE